jgi:hypothetical protein
MTCHDGPSSGLHGARAATALVIGGPARRSVTGKNALAHVAVLPDHYTRLAILERDAADHLRAQK